MPALAFFDQLSGVYSVTAFKITVKPTVAGFLAVFLQTVLLTEGVSILENLRAITLVCQSYNRFPLPTAEENVQHPMPPRKGPGPGFAIDFCRWGCYDGFSSMFRPAAGG